MKTASCYEGIEILETRIVPSTIDVVGGVMIFTGGAGESNTIDFRIELGSYRFSDGASPTLTGNALAAGVTSGGPGIVFVPLSVTGVTFNLGDMNDILNVQGLAHSLTVNGDAGTDSFTTNNFSTPPTLTTSGEIRINTESISISNCPINATGVFLTSDNLTINQTVTASNTLSIQTSTAGRPFSLGTEDPSRVSITTAEASRLVSPVIYIGSSNSGAIFNDAALNFGSASLTLTTGNGGLLTQSGAGAITVESLAILGANSVTMNGPNNVSELAAALNTGGTNLAFTDANGFAISAVNGVGGLSTNGGTVTLNAGAVTQDVRISSPTLSLQGAGPFTLDDAENEVNTLTANITGALSYTDATAFSVGGGNVLTSNANITLIADSMNIVGTINAGTGQVTLAPLNFSTVHLGGADGGGTLGITNAELSLITADIIEIGTGNSLVVSGAITANSNTLKLVGETVGGSGSITVPTLDVHTFGTFALTGASDVDILIFLSEAVTGTNIFNDADGFSLGDPVSQPLFTTYAPALTSFDVGTATLTLPSGTTFVAFVEDEVAGVGFTQVNITGTINIAGATLQASGGASVPKGAEYVIISNDGDDDVTGTFDGLDEGAAIPNFAVSATITYQGGDGNDVAIIVANPVPATVDGKGKTLTFRDVDGDVVTVKTTKGTFDGTEITGNLTGGLTDAGLFQKLTLGSGFSGANITITAKPGPEGGNGFVNLGYLDATGVDLGSVTIAGDLTRLSAGTVGGDVKVPAIKSLTVQSIGLLGESMLAGSDQGVTGLVLEGALSKLTVLNDLRADITITGALGTATIGGSVVGTLDISATTGISLLKVVGDIRANGGNITIESSEGAIGAVTVDGSIAGVDATDRVEILGFGQVTAPTKGTDLAIKTVTVKGSVAQTNILAGFTGVLNADASIGTISVGGDWIASNVTAGSGAGTDGFTGTQDDALHTGGRNHADLESSIGSFTVKGQALGTTGTTDMFGVVAQQIGKAKVGDRTFAFKADKTGTPNREAFFAAPTLDGEGTENPLFDFTIRELGVTTPTGLLTGGVDLDISSDGKTATFFDVDGDVVVVKRTAGTFVMGDFNITTASSGGGIFNNLTVTAAPDDKPVGLTITATPGDDGGNGFINLGNLDATGVPLAAVTIDGNLTQFVGGSAINGKPGTASLSVHSLGALGSGSASEFRDGLGKLTTKTDIHGSTLNALNVAVGNLGRIGAVTVGGSMISASISAESGLGSIKVAGSLRGATISSGAGAIGALSIGNDLIGDGLNPTISAFGQLTAPTKGADLAIKSLAIKGSIENVLIAAGGSGLAVNADASIGAVSVGRAWLASSVLAGSGAGTDALPGTEDDTKLVGTNTTRDATAIFSSIASITIKGQAFGTTAEADSFGIVAEQINSVKIGKRAFKFDKGEGDFNDAFALAPTFPGAGLLAFDFFAREITVV